MTDYVLVAEGGWTAGNAAFVGTIHRKNLSTGTWAIVHQVENWIVEAGFTIAISNPSVAVTVTNDSFGEDISYSTDAGATWTDVGVSLFFTAGAVPTGYVAISDDGTTIYGVNITGTQGIYKSTNFGTSWTKIADEPGVHTLGGGLLNRSIWQRGGTLWWITNDSTPHIRLGRCATDGSGLTTFTNAALNSFGLIQNVQLSGCASADVLTAFGDQTTSAPPVIVTSASGTPSFAASAAVSSVASYRVVAVTPVSASLFVAKIEDYTNSQMAIYTSADGVSSWTSRQTESDPNDEGDNFADQFRVAGSPSALYQPLVIPDLWLSTDGAGVTWSSETVPNINLGGSFGQAFVGVGLVQSVAAAAPRSFGFVIG